MTFTDINMTFLQKITDTLEQLCVQIIRIAFIFNNLILSLDRARFEFMVINLSVVKAQR